MDQNFLKLAQSRYSVRRFSDAPVPQEAVDSILAAASAAPTAKDLQPVRLYVIRSREHLDKLPRCTDCHFGAPLAILVTCDHSQSWKRDSDGADSGSIDAAIVATHMMLAGWEQGIGSTWVMWFDAEAVRREFSLPEAVEPVAFLMMGYPAENARPSRLHSLRKPLDEIVEFL